MNGSMLVAAAAGRVPTWQLVGMVCLLCCVQGRKLAATKAAQQRDFESYQRKEQELNASLEQASRADLMFYLLVQVFASMCPSLFMRHESCRQVVLILPNCSVCLSTGQQVD